MAYDHINLALIKDEGIRQKLKAAQQDKKLSDVEVTKIINAALADKIDNLRLDEQEVKDLLTIVDQSFTMSQSARNQIRRTILLEYTQYRIKDHKIGQALKLALGDKKLRLDELKDVVNQALDKEKNVQGHNFTLSPNEIEDLLLLAKSVRSEFRGYIFSVLRTNVWPVIPPPLTNPTPKLFEIDCQDKGGKYKVPVQILKDVTPTVSTQDVIIPSDEDQSNTIDILTSVKQLESGGAGTKVSIVINGECKYKTMNDKVSEVVRWPRIQKISIYTIYTPGAQSTKKSGYGRGTTDDDIRSRRVTLGWHEHCHRELYISLIKRTPLPQFNGAVGQSKAVFLNHFKDYKKAIENYLDRMETESVRLVDEVGYKLSEKKP